MGPVVCCQYYEEFTILELNTQMIQKTKLFPVVWRNFSGGPKFPAIFNSRATEIAKSIIFEDFHMIFDENLDFQN